MNIGEGGWETDPSLETTVLGRREQYKEFGCCSGYFFQLLLHFEPELFSHRNVGGNVGELEINSV